MWVVYVLIWGAVAIFGLSAVYGLVWAIRTRQLQDPAAGAASIFDDEEPIGLETDAFPIGRVLDSSSCCGSVSTGAAGGGR